MGANHLTDLVVIKVECVHDGPKMIAHHFVELNRPVVTTQEFDEGAHVEVVCVHG